MAEAVNGRGILRKASGKVLHWTTMWICTVLAGLLGILSYFGLTWDAFGSDKSRDQSESSGSSGSSLASIDPSLYVEFNSVTPQRRQECEGLIGLCIGQPIELAIDALGTSEANAFPQNVVPNEYQIDTRCHRWNPARITSIDVCEQNGSISSISVTFSGEPPASIAMPVDYTLRFPESLSNVGADISTQYDHEPFHSFFLFGEGEYIASFDWFFPRTIEGDPDIKVSIIGRSINDPSGPLPEACNGAGGVQYPYDQVLEASSEIMVESIVVASVAEADLRIPACP